VFIGDTDGSDVGRTSLLKASFNPTSLHIRESGNCVTRAQANGLIQSKQITPELVKHLQSALKQ
jgi:hypothetical protein